MAELIRRSELMAELILQSELIQRSRKTFIRLSELCRRSEKLFIQSSGIPLQKNACSISTTGIVSLLEECVPFHLVLETQYTSCSIHLSIERFILSVKNGSHWKRRMESKEIDVIKVQQVFYRLPFEKNNNFEFYRTYVINFLPSSTENYKFESYSRTNTKSGKGTTENQLWVSIDVL